MTASTSTELHTMSGKHSIPSKTYLQYVIYTLNLLVLLSDLFEGIPPSIEYSVGLAVPNSKLDASCISEAYQRHQ